LTTSTGVRQNTNPISAPARGAFAAGLSQTAGAVPTVRSTQIDARDLTQAGVVFSGNSPMKDR
jgi:hypothetical protein